MKTIFASVVLLIGCVSVVVDGEPIGECPAQDGQFVSFLPDTDCAEFHICAHGNPVNFRCPDPLLFDRELNVCNWAENVDCDGGDPEICLAD